MKKTAVFIFLMSLYFGGFGQTSNYWPYAFPFPKCSTMLTNCNKWPVVNNGRWDVGSTWNGGTVPANFDIVCIPSGWTVKIQGQTYSAETSCQSNPTATPRLRIFICGTLEFSNSAKLFLSCYSFIQVYTGGSIIPPDNSGSGDLIQIGSNIVWGGPSSGNQGPIIGPYILSWPYIGQGVLPVSFDYFKAEQKQPFSIRLDWGTIQETNNTAFIIERSSEQKTWEVIGSVTSVGNSTTRFTYSFDDKSPLSGNNYYRIKQVDLDGRTSYSEVVRVSNQVKKNISIYPNPVNATAQLYSKNNFRQGQMIRIVDAKGSLVKTITASGKNSMQIDMSNMLPGLYLVQLIENGIILENVSLIKQ